MRSSILAPAGAALLGLHSVLLWVPTPAAVDSQRLPDQLRDRVVRGLASGRLLVAARNLPDPNFAETVVLLTEFNAQGAMGLIVNRPTDVPLVRLLPGLEGARARDMTIFFGGPVPERGALALVRSATSQSDMRHVVDDVYLVNTRESLEEILASGTASNRFRVYVGYAGWGAGQLERETTLGSWHVVEGDGGVVFNPDASSVWQRLIRRIEARSARNPMDVQYHLVNQLGPTESSSMPITLSQLRCLRWPAVSSRQPR